MKCLHVLLPALILISAICTSCDKRGEWRAKLEAAQSELAAKQAESTRLQAEADRLSTTLPGGGHATEGRVNQLTQENEALRSQVEGLKKEKAATAEENTRREQEVRTYLATHSKP